MVFGSGKVVTVFATFCWLFWRSLRPSNVFIGAYDENLKRYDCCLWTEGREGNFSRGLKIFSPFWTKKMSKCTRSRERFPIGEWARKAKYKRIEAVEASTEKP